jgi:glycine/D-amino acid oxidase-like deaminating enzyme
MPAYDIAVIGAGVFGSWTAWHLRRAGASVLLLDAWGPAHARASSGGESRIIRMGYGPDEIYTRMALRSLEQWKSLFQRTGEPLFHRTGVLWMARHGDPYSEATRRTLAACAVPMELVTAAELEKRYPQMRVPHPDAFGILPVWIDFTDPRRPYGFPDLESRGFNSPSTPAAPTMIPMPAIASCRPSAAPATIV